MAEARDKGQSVTLVSHKDCSDQMQNMHDLLEEMFPQAGIMVRRVELADYAEANALVNGLAAQGGNMVVSCDPQALKPWQRFVKTKDVPYHCTAWGGAA